MTSTYTQIAIWISLFAAFGIGTIVAAVFSRWNAVSQLRQAWIDALRIEIAEYFHAIEKVGEAAFGSHDLRRDLRPRRDSALNAYRKIVLRLNLKERQHRRLDRSLRALLTTTEVANANQLDDALTAARRVLKAEWERTKYGPFYRLARQWKRAARRWEMQRQLVKLPR